METADLLTLYRTMVRIRIFEERTSALYRAGTIPGFLHVSIGQEASAAGACWPLSSRDMITSTHRGHGHCLAKGLAPEAMFAELMGRETGTNRGRGGSMHISDPDLGIFGANGIVAAGLPIATGAAFASQLRQEGRVVVSFFGDGAVAAGSFHEAVNLAALWRLPVIFFCENNHYAEFSATETQQPVSLTERAAGYGLEAKRVDGNDVIAVASAMTQLVDRARKGGGPFLVEAETYRWHGHYEGDPERYRSAEELETWKRDRDPLLNAAKSLQSQGASAEDLARIRAEVKTEMDEAVDNAEHAPEPDPSTLYDFVTVRRAALAEPPDAEGEPFRMMDAIREALQHALELDPSVFLAGVDIGASGNVFGITRGLYDLWPDRVLDTPISENGVIGLGVGAAMAGLKPVIELMYLDFLGVCFDQLLNQAAKLPFMSGGRAAMALTIRTQFGAGRSSGSQHSQSLEAILAHVPGLTVIMPSHPADAYGLLLAAIHDPNPVVFIENRLLYGMKGPRPLEGQMVPIGKARVLREGADVTVVSASRMVHEALVAATRLESEGIDTEVIDLRTISPLDKDTVVASLAKTSRLVIAHEAVQDFGIGGELAAIAAYEGFWHLDAPVKRVGARFAPAPYSPSLEKEWLPGSDRIAEAIRELIQS